MINRATRNRLLATTIFAGAAIFTSPALAQVNATAPQAAAAQPSAGPVEGQDPALAASSNQAGGGEIVVTGSRIASPNLTSTAPVTILKPAEIRNTGTTRIEDLLNQLPQVYAGQVSSLSNGATGIATVDLRSLGAERTLVLVNGRRLLPGDPTSSVADLNAIPSSLIKSVQVLTGGASSTYGADAVAGVVNFIMDTDFTGIRLDGQYSLYQHDNRNTFIRPLINSRIASGASPYTYPVGNTLDGGTVDATLTLGSGFDDNRGHVTAYVGYRKTRAITQDNRDYSACILQATSRGATGPQTGNQCGGSATANPGNAIYYDSGTSTFTGLGNGTIGNPLNRYNFAPTNYYQRPDERYTAGFFAHYDVSDAFKPYMEFMFMDDRTIAQIAPSGDFGNTLTVNCDNPLFSAQQRATICDGENLIVGNIGSFPLTAVSYPGIFPNQPTPGPITYFDQNGNPYNKAFLQILRRNVEGGPRINDLQHTQYRGVIGAKGDLGQAFSYDASYQYGRTVYSQIYSNEFSIARLNNALDVVSVNGVPTCRSVTTGADPNCVPYNIYSGSVSQAAVDYLSATGFQRGINEEQIANVSVTGRLGQYGVKTPWSDDGVTFNIGGEFRRESLDLKTDQEFSTGDLTGQGAPTKPVSGSFNVYEGFGEVKIPLVQDNFIHQASLEGGYRYSHYELSNGRKFDTNTFKVGGEISPIRDITFRGSYNRAVRAPNLNELFAPNIVALNGITDPCAGFVIGPGDTGCLAQGLRVGQTVIGNPAGQYNGFIGGQATLTPEKADTKTFGVVIQPSFLPRFVITADYFDIKIRNAIQQFGQDAILAECTTNVNPIACALINRDPAGSLWLTPNGFVRDLSSNIGGLREKGIDVNASYSYPLGEIGSLSASVVGTYLKNAKVDNGLTAEYDCAGYFGSTCGVPLPKWKHQARLSFDAKQGYGLTFRWRYIGKVKAEGYNDSPTLNGLVYDPSRIKAQSYFDLTANYTAAEHFSFRIGVQNLLDKQPPLVSSGNSSGNGSSCAAVTCNGNTYPGVYDALGRYLFVGASVDF